MEIENKIQNFYATLGSNADNIDKTRGILGIFTALIVILPNRGSKGRHNLNNIFVWEWAFSKMRQNKGSFPQCSGDAQ